MPDTQTTTPPVEAADPRNTATKPSWKTGEFWMQLAAIVLPLVLGASLFPPDSPVSKLVALGISVLAALGFTAVKGQEKRQAIKTAGDVAIAEAQGPTGPVAGTGTGAPVTLEMTGTPTKDSRAAVVP